MKKIKTPAIVTKDSLKELLVRDAGRVIARALVVIFERQTEDEKADNQTEVENGIGFTGFDAKSGTLTAKYFLKHKRLEQWQIDRWMKPAKDGYPRICRYAKQLNEIAIQKAQS